MIVPREELAQILRGQVGEVVLPEPLEPGFTDWVRSSPRARPACRATVVDLWRVGEGWAHLLARVTEGEVPQRPKERPKLTLNRKQRERLFAGEGVRIEGEGRCPVGKGDVVRLSARVSLEVTGHRPRRGGGWVLQYKLLDSRQAPRLLRRVPSISPDGFEAFRAGAEPTADVIEAAAVESAYTSTSSGAITDAGEAVDPATQAIYTREAHEGDHRRHQKRRADWERLTLLQRVEVLQELRGLSSADVSRELRAADHALRRAWEKLEREEPAA